MTNKTQIVTRFRSEEHRDANNGRDCFGLSPFHCQIVICFVWKGR